MKLIKAIKDADLGLSTPPPSSYNKRVTGRAIIFDSNQKIALLHVTKNKYHKLPGGSVEKGENIEAALRRESIEEIGCEITNIRELGIIEEYRNGLSEHQTSYCFIADAKGEEKTPNFTQEEIDDGFEVI